MTEMQVAKITVTDRKGVPLDYRFVEDDQAWRARFPNIPRETFVRGSDFDRAVTNTKLEMVQAYGLDNYVFVNHLTDQQVKSYVKNPKRFI